MSHWLAEVVADTRDSLCGCIAPVHTPSAIPSRPQTANRHFCYVLLLRHQLRKLGFPFKPLPQSLQSQSNTTTVFPPFFILSTQKNNNPQTLRIAEHILSTPQRKLNHARNDVSACHGCT